MKRLAHALFVIVGIVFAIWAIGLVRFAATLPGGVADDHTRTDAIVVLTGGSDRLATGLHLLEEDFAPRLLISGVAEAVTTDRLLEQLAMQGFPAELRPRIFLGRRATSTVQNAQETADWCREEGIRSIRLVTAAYHMKRSLLEFKQLMPGLQIVPHPVFPNAVKQGQWWKYPGTLLLMTREYTKFVIASLAHMFGMTTEDFS
jgi:uncharacterized SAM-binding protein YcdF (DUF218 family)